MTSRPLSIVNGGTNGSEAHVSGREESQRHHLLIQRLLARPTSLKLDSAAPDARLVQVASILLDGQLRLEEIFGWELCYSPVQRILFFTYVRQGQSRDTSIRSLCSTPVLGPGSVVLRWAAKLLDDRVLELTPAADPCDRLIRLTSEGVFGLEQSLRFIESEIVRSSASRFSA